MAGVVEVAAFLHLTGLHGREDPPVHRDRPRAGRRKSRGDEELELVRVPLDQVPSLLEEVEDGKTLAGLLLLLHCIGRLPPP